MIEQLWSRMGHRTETEMEKLQQLLQRQLKKLILCLNEAEQEILQKYTDCIWEYLFSLEEQAFRDGFRLEVRMMAEAVGGETSHF